MKIINRYLVMELIPPFLFGVTAFTGIFVGTNLLFRLTEYYSKWGVGLFTLIQLFFLNLPAIIVLTFPMATLLSIIMAFGRLSSDGEVTALRAGGVSIYRLVIPALVIGLLMAVVTIGINELIVPAANYRSEQIVWQFMHGEKLPSSQRNLFLTPLAKGKPDYVLYTSIFDGETGIMEDVIMQDYEDGKPTSIIEAEKAVWAQDAWVFYNGKIMFLKEGEKIPALEFNEYTVKKIDYKPARISQVSKQTVDMTMWELKSYIEMKKEQGKNVNEELVEYYHRTALSFACFIFALVAAPLGLQPRRSGGSATGLGLSVIIIFIYYSLMTFGTALGKQGTIPPFLGAWVQNIVFMIIGGVMLFKVGR